MSGGRFAIAHVREHWYVLCRADELGEQPLRRELFATPVVLFRGADGAPTALLDRCAHRNVPLSGGRVVGGQIECPYHGWRFDAGGACQHVPALVGPSPGKARRVPRFATREAQGYVWVYGTPDAEPQHAPFRVPHLDDDRYGVVRYESAFAATLHATAENILDVPHTAFLHKGLFRGAGKSHLIEARVRRSADRVEAQYVGEPRPAGLAGRLLAPRGGTVAHFDRFILPSIAQVEYALGEASHLVITNLLTPVSDFMTALFSVATFRLPLPAQLVRAVLTPIAKRVVQQDADILKLQTEAVRRFGTEQFVSTDVDLMGPHILRLLKQAERGEPPVDAVVEESVQLEV